MTRRTPETPEVERPITKKTLAALEKVFVAEIEGRLPFQSKAKVYQRLCDEGLLQPMQRIFGGRIPMRVTGYQLTHAGRLTYCLSCDDEEEPDGPPSKYDRPVAIG